MKLLSSSLRKTNNFYDVTMMEAPSTLNYHFFEIPCSHFIFSSFLFLVISFLFQP